MISFLLSLCEFRFLEDENPKKIASSLQRPTKVEILGQEGENPTLLKSWYFYPISCMLLPNLKSVFDLDIFCSQLKSSSDLVIPHVLNYLFRGYIQKISEKKLNPFYIGAYFLFLVSIIPYRQYYKEMFRLPTKRISQKIFPPFPTTDILNKHSAYAYPSISSYA